MTRMIVEEREFWPVMQFAAEPYRDWGYNSEATESSYTPAAEFTDDEIAQIRAAFAAFRVAQAILEERYSVGQKEWDVAHPREPFDPEAHKRMWESFSKMVPSWLDDELIPRVQRGS